MTPLAEAGEALAAWLLAASQHEIAVYVPVSVVLPDRSPPDPVLWSERTVPYHEGPHGRFTVTLSAGAARLGLPPSAWPAPDAWLGVLAGRDFEGLGGGHALSRRFFTSAPTAEHLEIWQRDAPDGARGERPTVQVMTWAPVVLRLEDLAVPAEAADAAVERACLNDHGKMGMGRLDAAPPCVPLSGLGSDIGRALDRAQRDELRIWCDVSVLEPPPTSWIVWNREPLSLGDGRTAPPGKWMRASRWAPSGGMVHLRRPSNAAGFRALNSPGAEIRVRVVGCPAPRSFSLDFTEPVDGVANFVSRPAQPFDPSTCDLTGTIGGPHAPVTLADLWICEADADALTAPVASDRDRRLLAIAVQRYGPPEAWKSRSQVARDLADAKDRRVNLGLGDDSIRHALARAIKATAPKA